MTSPTSPALAVALKYYDAWTTGQMDDAMAYVADDIVCDAPAGRIAGAAAYRAFLEPFTHILRSARMLAAFGDDTTALMMYETETVPVPCAPGAECLTVVGGRITQSRFLFDRAPFDAARAASG
jgi:ketosteroid isomerase-like protein